MEKKAVKKHTAWSQTWTEDHVGPALLKIIKDKEIMTNKNKEILVKALEKAINNGMKAPATISKVDDVAVEKREIYDGYYESIILSKEFAKAFWKWEDDYMDYLQQMVVQNNRIAYLEKFL